MPASAKSPKNAPASVPAPESDPLATLAFEEATARLEEIVRDMENSRLPLESLIARYEEGVRLVAVCQKKLQAAEERIETISRAAAAKNSPESSPQPPQDAHDADHPRPVRPASGKDSTTRPDNSELILF